MRKPKDVMQPLWLVVASCLFVAGAAQAQQPQQTQPLDTLIHANVQSATSSYTDLTAEKKSSAAQLWIHVRSQGQRELVTDRMSWFRGLQIGGVPVAVRPIQLVGSGPAESQLRYFKHEDRDRAEQLHKELAAGIAGLRLQDLSGQYQKSTWLKSGHFELWLSPTWDKLTAP